MKPRSLEEKIQACGGALNMMRSSTTGSYNFPLPPQYSTWPEEQRAWAETALLGDMGQHMSSDIFKGPDVKRLFSDLAINSFATFKKGNAKQVVFCREDGYVIGDGVVVALEDDEYELMAMPTNVSWLNYHIKKGGYDVSHTDDPPTGWNTKGRRFYRYQIQGPLAIEILEKAIGGPMPEIKFFHVGEIEIAGLKVRAISHTMSRKPGFELFGPRAEGPQILQALRNAGREFGMRESGAIALPTNATESGWIGMQIPAIYTGAEMEEFRKTISEFGFEGFSSLGGSFDSNNVEDFYMTPWDLGYGRLIKFDHDFIGRAALEKMAAEAPKRQKVWLRWDDEDVTRVMTSGLFGKEDRAKILTIPHSPYATHPYDALVDGDKVVGVSIMVGYTVNVGGWSSVGVINSEYAVDGKQVELVWGDAAQDQRAVPVEKHVLKRIKVTISTKPLIA